MMSRMRAVEHVRIHWFLYRASRRGFMELEDGEVVPAPVDYPPPWHITHLREYLCDLLPGDHWWGPEHDRALGSHMRAKTCRVCRSSLLIR